MFGLMKPIAKESVPSGSMTFADLHAGCVIGFGYVPQKSISGRRLPVSQINSYIFDADSFIAYRLEGDSADVNLIVADEGDPAGTYLALSQRVDPRMFESLFPGSLPQDWFVLTEGMTVAAKPATLGALLGWLAPRYAVTVATKGRFLEGDYRLRKSADRVRLSRPFDYVLLVDEDNEYALEAEKYEDGTMHVFATVYRPATDIGELTRAPKSSMSSIEIIPHIAPMEPEKSVPAQKPAEALKPLVEKTAVKEAVQERIKEPSITEMKKPEVTSSSLASLTEPKLESKPLEVKAAVKISDTQVKQAESLAAPMQEIADLVVKASLTPDDGPSVHTKFGRIQTGSAEVQGSGLPDMLACDLRLAGKLINESQRNQMPLSEVIRKVIDLPARVKEEVFIPFALNDAETAELARRYNLPAGDADGVKKQIIEELQRFVGEKK